MNEDIFSGLQITPDQEFWGHCSNLQAWYENNYNTRLLHSSIAFPLLKKLMELGDIRASKVFKEEIAKRLADNYPPVNQLLIENNYLNYLSNEELEICCPKELKVYNLVLASRNLTDIPPLIRELPIQGLKFLNLINNSFSTFPIFILKFRSIEVLLMNENQLITVPHSIEQLTRLEKLDLSRNHIRSLPNSLGNLKSLKSLVLDENYISLLPESIGNLVLLKKLILSNNKLERLLRSIGKLKNLELLSLRANRLSYLPSTLKNLNSIKSLDLSCNKFQNLSTAEFIKILHLRVARNSANSMIQKAEQFLNNNSINSKQKLLILEKISKLKRVIKSDDFEEIECRTHDLSLY